MWFRVGAAHGMVAFVDASMEEWFAVMVHTVRRVDVIMMSL
mgnify:CR=1 FL=1